MDISNNTYAAACAGSTDAYASIVNKYKSLICAITYNTTGNLELSEEIAQEVFLTGWQHLSELRSPSKLRSWLCGIARNIARDKNRINRQKQTEALTKDIVARSHADSDPVELAITKEKQEIIWESVSGIPEIYREVLILFYREQQSIKEVAELLDLSQATIKQRLHRSRQMLKGRITSLVEETLRSSRPGKAFTCAVLASLIPTKQALAGGALSAGYIAAIATPPKTLWISMASTATGIIVFLISKGYWMLMCFIAFSVLLIFRRIPSIKNIRTDYLMWSYIVLVPSFALLEKPLTCLTFAILGMGRLYSWHPQCPSVVRKLFNPERVKLPASSKTLRSDAPPADWKRQLVLYCVFIVLFVVEAVHAHLRHMPGISILLALLVAKLVFNASRMTSKVYSCRKKG